MASFGRSRRGYGGRGFNWVRGGVRGNFNRLDNIGNIRGFGRGRSQGGGCWGLVGNGDRGDKEDWLCIESACRFNNFGWRQKCQKCGTERSQGGGCWGHVGNGDRGDKEDWLCLESECRFNNFGWRQECQKCGTEKLSSGDDSCPAPPKLYIPSKPKGHGESYDGKEICSGINYDAFESVKCTVSGTYLPSQINDFESANLRPVLMKNVCKSGYKNPTPIQKFAIPIILAGRDLFACTQINSGETAAFLIPIIQKLLDEPLELMMEGMTCQPRAVIVTPVRELTTHINDEVRKLAYGSNLKVCTLYGGTGTQHQALKLLSGCHILVTTPGRLLDLLYRERVSFDSVRFFVLDKAEWMLDLGYLEHVKKMLNHLTTIPAGQSQTLVFSLALPNEVQKLADGFLNDHLSLEIRSVGGSSTDIQQEFYQVSRNEKKVKLKELLMQDDEKVLVFVKTRRLADYIAVYLNEQRIPTTSIHEGRMQREREIAINDFNYNWMRVLVLNLDARGILVKGVTYVINFDLPNSIDQYIYRIELASRFGSKRKAISFYDADQDFALAPDLVKVLQQGEQEVPGWLDTGSHSRDEYDHHTVDHFTGFNDRKGRGNGVVGECEGGCSRVNNEGVHGYFVRGLDRKGVCRSLDGEGNKMPKRDWICPETACRKSNFDLRQRCPKCDTKTHKVGGENSKPKMFTPPKPFCNTYLNQREICSSANCDAYDTKTYQVSGNNPPPPINDFESTKLKPLLIKNLYNSGYKKPTPIQKFGIPFILAGRDLMACTQIGSGKTAAFLIPIIEKLLDEPSQWTLEGNMFQPQAVIVTPSRELTSYISGEARKFAKGSILKVFNLCERTVTHHQSSKLVDRCHILVATPGKLDDLVNRRKVSFTLVRYFVLDSADRILHLGYLEDVKKILGHRTLFPAGVRQTLVFSSISIPEEILHLADQFLSDYLTVGISEGVGTDIQQMFYQVARNEKKNKLKELLMWDTGKVLVFVDTKRNADFIAVYLTEQQIPTTSVHGDRQQREREIAFNDFNSNRQKVIVMTLDARDVHLKGVTLVINYDLPLSIDQYIYRIERSSRFGNKRKAISFYDADKDSALAPDLVRVLKQAKQEVPKWLEAYSFTAGSQSKPLLISFGGHDYRKAHLLKNLPQVRVEEEEEVW